MTIVLFSDTLSVILKFGGTPEKIPLHTSVSQNTG